MWKIFLNNLWNVFSAILTIAIILAPIVGAVYLMGLGGPVVIFIFAFLFVIATCYIDARRKHHKNIDENKHSRLCYVRLHSDALFKELEKYGYSLDAEHMLNLVNVTIKEYEDEYGTDECIQYQKDRINKMLELYKK
jgi:hypothetical protein